MAMTGASRLGPLFVRIPVGIVFAFHGYQKLFEGGRAQLAEGIAGFGFPQPELLSHVVAWGEFAGGLLLILGFAARLAALVNVGTMVVALWKVHLISQAVEKGWKAALANVNEYQLPLVLLGALLGLVFMGAGALSIDSALSSRRAVA